MSKPILPEPQEGVSGAEMFDCGIDGVGHGSVDNGNEI